MTPAWLADFQRDFGAAIRTPLDRATGTLRAAPARYAAQWSTRLAAGPTLPALERLAVYNRQYWFRLFGVLQNEYPLTARLCGFWAFNDYAARFLLAHPPASADIHRAADGFDHFLGGQLDERATSPPSGALREAAAIDAAFTQLWHAPAPGDDPPWQLRPSDEARLARGRLRPRATWTLVREHWPLFQLRRALADRTDERPAPLPSRHARPVWYVVVHRPDGVIELQLADRQALLFAALRNRPVAEALAELEARSSPAERRQLATDVRSWLARSVELGFWGGLDA